LSGSGGSSSLPPNANLIDTQNQYDYNFGQTRFDNINGGNAIAHSKGHAKKYSVATSSLNEYPSSNNEHDSNYENNEK
jgi:hypothetical protein